MYCMKCGTQVADTAKFCMECGVSLAKAPAPQPTLPVKWEYRDITISFEGPVFHKVRAHGPKEKTMIEVADLLILQAIQQAADEGWQSDEPTTFRWLAAHGRCAARRVGTWATDTHTYRSVTIRLKRPIYAGAV